MSFNDLFKSDEQENPLFKTVPKTFTQTVTTNILKNTSNKNSGNTYRTSYTGTNLGIGDSTYAPKTTNPSPPKSYTASETKKKDPFLEGFYSVADKPKEERRSYNPSPYAKSRAILDSMSQTKPAKRVEEEDDFLKGFYSVADRPKEETPTSAYLQTIRQNMQTPYKPGDWLRSTMTKPSPYVILSEVEESQKDKKPNPWNGKNADLSPQKVNYASNINARTGENRDEYDSRIRQQYAALSTASEVAMQRLLGGISALGGKTSLVNLSENLINKIGNVNLRLTARLGNRMLGEGAEEGLQTYMEAALRNVLFDEDYNLRDVSEEALYNSMLGAVTAFVTESPEMFSEYAYSHLNDQSDWDFQNQDFLSEDFIAEQERMSRSSEYAVGKDMTSSGDFIRRFSLMTDDIPLRREFYQECKNMLHRRSGNNGEDLLYYNPRLNKWYRSTSGTEAGKPDYTDEIWLGLRENKNNELIAFHNHPLGMPPSAFDLNAALQNGYSKGYTIGHNGRIFEYTAPRERISVDSYNTLISKYLNLGYGEFAAQCAALDYLKELYCFTYREVR